MDNVDDDFGLKRIETEEKQRSESIKFQKEEIPQKIKELEERIKIEEGKEKRYDEFGGITRRVLVNRNKIYNQMTV